MLKLNKEQKREPLGGHQFHEHGYTFKGDSFSVVETKVRKFRVRNGLPMGNPEQDILNYYAMHWPYMVKEDRETPEPVPPSEELTGWMEWLGSVWRHPPTKVISTREAKDRWNVCKDCPFNKPLKFKETDEVAEYKRRAFLLRRGVTVPEFLGFCSLHKADLSVFTLLDSPDKFSMKDANAAGECWCSLEGKAS